MRQFGLMGALVGLPLISGTCFADTETLARVGAWQAFGGTTTDGRPVCGMSSSGSGKYFSIKYFDGDDTLTIQLGNSQWSLKNNAKVRVELQFDNASPWKATASGMHFGDGDAGLQFDISRKQLDQFLQEFRDSNRLSVRFPEEDVTDWNGSLEGTDSVTSSFIGCVRKL